MKKQLIALISCISLLFGSLNISVYAKPAYSNENKIELLYELGIIDSRSEYKITLKSYLKMLANLSGVGDMDPISFGVSMEMLKGNEDGKSAITVSDAVRYSVIALGYRFAAEQSGGNETAYNQLAAKLKLTKGITVDSKKALTYTDAVQLIYNMLDATPMVIDLGTANSYKKSDETMLSLKKKVYKISGIVTATPKTSIYKADGCLKNQIEVDMNSYKVKEGKSFDDFLGKRVEAYISTENNDEYLLYMCEDNNSEVTIDAEDIISVADGIIRYDNNSREKTVKYDFPPKVIVNGRFFSDYTNADLMPSIGSVKLIDNDDDGKSEIIIVEDYNEVILASRNPVSKSLIYRKVFSNTEETIELEDVDFQIYKNGKESNISELNVNDILLVKESRDKKAVIIEASDVKLEGEIKYWDPGEKKLTLNGTDYIITSGVIQKLDDNTVSIEVGERYKFYLNSFGDIADVESASKMDYYLFFRVKPHRGAYTVEYMDTNNEWHEADMSDKVIWEDVRCSKESVFDILKDEKPQLAKIRFNGKGDVKEIVLSSETNLSDKDKFTRTPTVTEYYYSAQRTINYDLFAEKGAMVLEIPVGEKISDKNLYAFSPIENRFKNDKKVSCKAYDIDEYRFSKMFTMEMTSDNIALSDNYFLVTRIRSTLLDDEPTTELVGLVGRFSNFSYLAKDPGIVSDVKEGDLIRFHLDKNGNVDSKNIVFSLSSPFVKNWKLPNSNAILVSGIIEAIDSDKGIIRIDSGSGSKTLMLTGTKSVIKYNKKKSEVRIADFAELKVGDCVVMNFDHHKIVAMYCIE